MINRLEKEKKNVPIVDILFSYLSKRVRLRVESEA